LKINFGKTDLGTPSKVLRVLIPLVCPNIDRCPGMAEATKTLCSPAVGERLREMASS
jgi:hypothetical protein